MTIIGRRAVRFLVVLTAAAGAFALTAAPAHADPVAVSRSVSVSLPYTVAGGCSAVIGATQDFNTVTYAVEGDAVASSTNLSVPVGTTVNCRVFDKTTGVTYGKFGGGVPGPAAVAVDTVEVPFTANVGVEWCGAALFSDGGSFSRCEGPLLGL